MRIWLPAALAVTVATGLCAQVQAHGAGMGSGGIGGGCCHGKGAFHRPANPFPIRRFRNEGNEVAAADYDQDDQGIEQLRFRVQEPFGPWDIGRPRVRIGENAPYQGDPPWDPWHGYEPRDW